MASLETGRVCMKSVGRESGGYCVVLKNVNKSFVLVTGPKILTGVKRRNANIIHLQPTEHKIDVTQDSTDEQVIEAMKKGGLVKKFGLKLPSAAQLKARKDKEAKKAEAAAKPEEVKKKEAKPDKKEVKHEAKK